jgi:hypothetical protein
MLWPCRAATGLRGCVTGRMRPKDLGTLDGFRGGLIIPRRVQTTPDPRIKSGLGCLSLAREQA